MASAFPRSIETVIIGAGQAGLIMSWHLQRAGRPHVVLDRRETLGGGWQDRWDGFVLVGPNWTTGLPGHPYEDGDPDGFMARDEVAARMRRYAEVIDAPVHRATEVTRLSAGGRDGRRFHLETSGGPIEADEVIVATGAFHRPKMPAAASGFDSRIVQVHSHHYRNPAQLAPGGVLIVGSGQTGVQLAEELHEAGREVFLSVGHCGRAPRRYRGHDMFFWLRQLASRGDAFGTPLPSVDQLPEPRRRFACNPHLSGHHGGHDTNLRQMALDGIHLVGRFTRVDGERATFAPDLRANLTFADEFFDLQFRALCDTFAERAGIEVADDDRAWPTFDPPEVTELDLTRAGISTVLWTTGYAPDYAWLDLPIHDEFGVPRHVRGVSEVPGLSFIGLLWQLNNASANLSGVAVDAEYLASRW
ncbi:MAG TPA: NAD(P)-binding domain-containing protein [Candidatus Limnocylindrales bacterium]|nr:NAD(P)-binding domain-containing protein [Candidatus Limnocylindrales bacterium]